MKMLIKQTKHLLKDIKAEERVKSEKEYIPLFKPTHSKRINLMLKEKILFHNLRELNFTINNNNNKIMKKQNS